MSVEANTARAEGAIDGVENGGAMALRGDACSTIAATKFSR